MRKFFLIASSIVLLFVGLRSYSALFFSIKNHLCFAGELLSPEYVLSISRYISDEAHKNIPHQTFAAQLKQVFPVIKKVEISFRPSGPVITIEPHEPICSVNDLFVFTSNKSLLSKAIFSLDVIEGIPAVSVASNTLDNSAQLLIDIFDALPFNFNNFYNLDCIKEHCIRLVDKSNPQFVILSTREQKNYQRLFEHCEFIKHSLNDRGAFDRGIEWIADARFAHYIIAYKA